MKREFDAHREAEEAKENGIPAPNLPTRRPQVISALVDYRKKIFNKYPAHRASIESEIHQRYTKARETTKAERVKLMKTPLFRLSETVRAKARYWGVPPDNFRAI